MSTQVLTLDQGCLASRWSVARATLEKAEGPRSPEAPLEPSTLYLTVSLWF